MSRVRTAPLLALGLLDLAAAVLLWGSAAMISRPAGLSALELTRWIDRQGAAPAAVWAVWFVAAVCCSYATAVICLGVLAGLSRERALAAVTLRLATPTLRRALEAAFGVGLLLSVPTPAASADPVTMHVLDAPPTTRPDPTAPAPDPTSGAPTMRRVEQPEAPAPADPPVEAGPPAAVVASTEWHLPESYEVAAGDHLWGIAQRTLAGAWGRTATDGETDRYLDRLVTANRDRLAVPGHPELIFSGQVFRLPDPGAP